jgi:hypothetical protein
LKASKLIIAAALSVSAFVASAAVLPPLQTVSYSGLHSSSSTDWSDVFSLQKFDSGLGALQSIDVDLYGSVGGDAKVESLDASASNVALNLNGLIKLATVTGSELIVINPLLSKTFALTAFDGLIDFSGASGKTLTGLSSSTSGSNHFSGATWLSMFTGPGAMDLSLSAKGVSSASGSGNLISQFATNAAANYKVTYTYAAAVPEPETYALMGLGVLALLARRRKVK